MDDFPIFRVWPDGTVQDIKDGEPYSFMSDDFLIVSANDEIDVYNKVMVK